MTEYQDFPSIKSYQVVLFAGATSIVSNILFLILIAALKQRSVEHSFSVTLTASIAFNLNLGITAFCFCLSSLLTIKALFWIRNESRKLLSLLSIAFGMIASTICFPFFVFAKQLFYPVFGASYWAW